MTPVSLMRPDVEEVKKHVKLWLNVEAWPGDGGDGSDFVAFRGGRYREVLREVIRNSRPMNVNHKEVDQMMRGAIDIEEEEGKLRKMPIE